MNYSEKIIFKPQLKKENLENILKIILLLAKANGYDKNFRIKNEFGRSIENTNILNLIKHLTDSKFPNLPNDYLKLLIRANIDPSLIDNNKILSKLNKSKKQSWIYPKNG